MSNKKNIPLVLFLVVLFSCQSTERNDNNSQETLEKSAQQTDDTGAAPEILLAVYDSLERLEDPANDSWNEAILKASQYSQYIWKPLEERLEFLSKSAVIRAGEKITESRREERREAFKRYLNLRRSLAKIVRLHPESDGLALLIRHLEEDIPEGLEVLKAHSKKNYGYDQKKWSHWFISERLRRGTVDTRQAISDYQRASVSERIKILKTWLSVTGELKVQSIAESESSSEIGQRRVATFDLETIRLQALAVFLEALKESHAALSNMAILSLVQLGDLAEPSLIDLVQSSTNKSQRSRAVTALGHSKSFEVAESLVRWSGDKDLRQSALQAVGNLKISQESAERILPELEKMLQREDISREDQMRILAALVAFGQTERFLLMLEFCQEPKNKEIDIDSRTVKDFYWLQVRRVAQRAFNSYIEKRQSHMPLWQQSALEGQFNPQSGFHKYVTKNHLNLSKKNWKKWWKEKLLKFS